MSGAPYGITVTVVRPAVRDRNGDVDPGSAVTFPVDGCARAWGMSTEDTDRRETALWDVTLYCPTGTDIRHTDKIVFPGDPTRYDVVGMPQRWDPHPLTGWQPDLSVVVRLKAVL